MAAHWEISEGWDVVSELRALGRIGNPLSVPLLLHVAECVPYSHARRVAIESLAPHDAHALVGPFLREAAWDCECASRIVACEASASLEAERVRELADDEHEEPGVREAASGRLARDGASAQRK